MNSKVLFNYLKKSFITGSFKTIVVSVVTLTLLPLIINKIGLERYGLVSMTMIFGSAVVFVDFGISKTITLLLGKTEKLKDKNLIVADSFLISMLILGVLAIILIILDYCNISILGKELDISTNLKRYIVLVGFITLLLSIINNMLIAILDSYLMMHLVNVGFALSSISFNIILFIVGWFFKNDFVLVSVPLISSSLLFLYYLILVKVRTDINVEKPNVNRAKRILSTSLKFLGLSLSSTAALPLSKYALVLLSGNPIFIGVYDLSIKIALLANSFLNSISQPLLGVFSKFQDENERVFKIANKISVIIFLLYALGVLSYYFIGENLVKLIDLENYSILFSTSFMLLLLMSFTSVSEPVYRAFMGVSLLKKAILLKLGGLFAGLICYLVFYKYEPLYRISLSYGLALFSSSVLIVISGWRMQNIKKQL
ncbi:hypothetical protein N9B77_00230 [Flavobacteriaceae bacterium]|nr:hypothetical protein [Flavobacteriaceae bacterium]